MNCDGCYDDSVYPRITWALKPYSIWEYRSYTKISIWFYEFPFIIFGVKRFCLMVFVTVGVGFWVYCCFWLLAEFWFLVAFGFSVAFTIWARGSWYKAPSLLTVLAILLLVAFRFV